MVQNFFSRSASYRANTEDRALALNVGRGWIVCIADGTGGVSGGAHAAELFIAGVSRAAEQPAFDLTSPGELAALLDALDREIARDPLAGETTGIAIAITSSTLVGASSGNSQAWLGSSNRWHELTEHQLAKARLGTGCSQARPFAGNPYGTLLVATDGLFDYVRFGDIANVLGSAPADPAAALVQLVASGFRKLPDDVAVIVGLLQ